MALADTIDFNGASAGNTGTWAWTNGVGNTLTATYNSAANTASDVDNMNSVNVGAITFTTGGQIALGLPAEFKAAGSSISVAGCGGTCFTGAFTDIQELKKGSSSPTTILYTFTGDFVGGTLNPILLAALGDADLAKAANGTVSGTIEELIPKTGPVQYRTISMDLTVTQTPEPSTLSLLTGGLL